MNELGQTLNSGWKSSGSGITPPPPPEQLIIEALRLKGESQKFQRGNLLILGSSFLMMCYFLLFYFGFREPLSHVGVAFMLGFFLFRIVLEAYSVLKGGKKKATDSATESLEKEKKYLELRLRIHGFYTYLTLSAYTAGFLFLLPEFSKYISAFWMAAMVSSYFIPGILLTLLIRKNVQKELQELRTVVELRKRILE